MMKNIFFTVALFFALNIYAQDDKTVTLVVSGQGKTQDEAKQNALRSAIEQAFGTFISSETVVNNDSFVSDNITSLSQGSILKFDILSSNEFPDKGIALTLSATVSITQIQKLTESKGHSVSISGGLFGINLKMNKLQSDAELKIIEDMCNKSLLLLEQSIDFSIEVLPPKKSDLRTDLQESLSEGNYRNYWYTEDLTFDNIYKIRMIVECKANSNLDVFIDYFINTLNAVKMSDAEIDFAKQAGSDIQTFEIIGYGNFNLRNPESIKKIKALFKKSTFNLVNYDIVANQDIINYSPLKYKRRVIDRIDSSHYVFIYDLLGHRTIGPGGSVLDVNYPTDFDETNRWGITIYGTNSDYAFDNYRKEGIWHHIFGDISNAKKTTTLKNMQTRYQVLDYYLPLSDVEKLDSIRIIRKN